MVTHLEIVQLCFCGLSVCLLIVKLVQGLRFARPGGRCLPAAAAKKEVLQLLNETNRPSHNRPRFRSNTKLALGTNQARSGAQLLCKSRQQHLLIRSAKASWSAPMQPGPRQTTDLHGSTRVKAGMHCHYRCSAEPVLCTSMSPQNSLELSPHTC